MSNIYFSGGLLEIAYPSDRCLPEAAAGQGVRFRPEAGVHHRRKFTKRGFAPETGHEKRVEPHFIVCRTEAN